MLNIMAVLMVELSQGDADAEQGVSSWLTAMPEPSFREGAWQLFLLRTDRPPSHRDVNWWEALHRFH